MTEPEKEMPFRNGTVCFTTADFFLSSTSDLEWHILFLRTHVSRAWCSCVCADKIHVSWCCYPTVYGDTIMCKSTLSRDYGSEQASRPGHFSCSVETNLTGGRVGQRVNLNVEEKNESIFFAGNWIRIVWSFISYNGERSDFFLTMLFLCHHFLFSVLLLVHRMLCVQDCIFPCYFVSGKRISSELRKENTDCAVINQCLIFLRKFILNQKFSFSARLLL